MSGKHQLLIPTKVIYNRKGGMVAKKNSQEQTQLVEAIGYFKALKENAPEKNPKIIEMLDRAVRDTQDALFKLLESRLPKSTGNL
jgi:hypothetical protein